MTPPISILGRAVRRLGIYGDLPNRIARRLVSTMPWFLEPLLTFCWLFPFFAVAKNQRRAVADNLLALHPGWGRWRAKIGAWQVFWNFANVYRDGLRYDTQTGAFDWAVDGKQHLEELSEHKGGCIILTAHMGNYDMAAPVFAHQVKRKLFAVRAPEREPKLQEVRKAQMERNEASTPNLHTLYNIPGNMLGVELSRLLAQGNVVAVQGDRVVFDLSAMEIEVEPGLHMRLPKGPLALAQATSVPCFPLFTMRDGWRRYRVKIFPALILPQRQRNVADPANVIWTNALLQMIRKNWHQWFVFEPVFRSR